MGMKKRPTRTRTPPARTRAPLRTTRPPEPFAVEYDDGGFAKCCGRVRALIEHGETHAGALAAHSQTCPLRPPAHGTFATWTKPVGFLAKGDRFEVRGAKKRALAGVWEVRAHVRYLRDRHGYLRSRGRRDVIVARRVNKNGTLSASNRAQRHFAIDEIRALISARALRVVPE